MANAKPVTFDTDVKPKAKAKAPKAEPKKAKAPSKWTRESETRHGGKVQTR